MSPGRLEGNEPQLAKMPKAMPSTSSAWRTGGSRSWSTCSLSPGAVAAIRSRACSLRASGVIHPARRVLVWACHLFRASAGPLPHSQGPCAFRCTRASAHWPSSCCRIRPIGEGWASRRSPRCAPVALHRARSGRTARSRLRLFPAPRLDRCRYLPHKARRCEASRADDAGCITRAVDHLGPAESAIDHFQIRERLGQVPPHDARRAGEDDFSPGRRVDAVLFLKLPDGRFPAVRIGSGRLLGTKSKAGADQQGHANRAERSTEAESTAHLILNLQT